MEAKVKFGTFSGVFVPSVLAILGAVMYYIAPKVLGGVGLLPMLGIIMLAHSITIATAFSISAISTNINVKGGGLYYLISRSLGSEFGGSLGVQLYLAQTVASAFYAIAFAQGVASVMSIFGWVIPEIFITLASLLFFGAIAYVGAHFVIKIQYFILGAIVLSLLSIFFAPQLAPGATISLTATGGALSFWVAFAMFFPAVTGIDAGVGMSGELKNPRKSLVVGTFVSILVTMTVYILLAIKMSAAATPEMLFTDRYVVQNIALIPQLVILGVLLATSSSALSCMMTAPRSMRAMVEDKVVPPIMSFLGKTLGKGNEPRVALLLSLLIGVGVIMMGGLDFVSQVVSMFFLSVYGWINGAAFFEKISRNPSYRPSFNAPWLISLYGMLACYFVMFLFNPLVMVLVILFQVSIFYMLYKTRTSVKLESVWDGVLFQLLRSIMEKIEHAAKSKKNWRPTIVAFCANELNRTAMASLLTWIGENRSITKMYNIIRGDISTHKVKEIAIETNMRNYIRNRDLDIFSKVVISDNVDTSIRTIMQSETLGNLPMNTVVLDFDESFDLDSLIPELEALGKNIILVRNQKGFSDFQTIDVWWNTPENGNLMIMLAFLITHSKQWKEKDPAIRLFKVVKDDAEFAKAQKALNAQIQKARIENISVYILKESGNGMKEIISRNSRYADLVILGMPHYKERKSDKEITTSIRAYTDKLKTSLIVLAHDQIDFKIN